MSGIFKTSLLDLVKTSFERVIKHLDDLVSCIVSHLDWDEVGVVLVDASVRTMSSGDIDDSLDLLGLSFFEELARKVLVVSLVGEEVLVGEEPIDDLEGFLVLTN